MNIKRGGGGNDRNAQYISLQGVALNVADLDFFCLDPMEHLKNPDPNGS